MYNEKKKDSVLINIHKEEIKEHVQELKTFKSSLKKLCSLIYGNFTESVKTILKSDECYEDKSKDINWTWILEKVKTNVSGLNKNVNMRVLLHDSI